MPNFSPCTTTRTKQTECGNRCNQSFQHNPSDDRTFYKTRIAVFAFLIFFFLCGRAQAQFTTVSGTVTDTNGVPYSCGSITATLINNNGISPTLNGVVIQGFVSPVKLGCSGDPTTPTTAGAFQMQLADNTQIKCGISVCGSQTQWQFTVNGPANNLPPLGTGSQTCSATLTISGASQSITSSFNACPALSSISTHFPLAAPNGSAAAPSYGSLSFPGQGMFFNSGSVCLSTFNDGAHGICFLTSAATLVEQNLANGPIQLQAPVVPITSQQTSHNAHPLRPIELGSCTMAAATTCTFTTTTSYNSTPLGFANPQSTIATTANQAICTVSGTTATITAALSNSLTWNCALIGNPD